MARFSDFDTTGLGHNRPVECVGFQVGYSLDCKGDSMKWLVLSAVCAMTLSTGAHANTWDEPWQETVVARATSFGLFKVDRVTGSTAHALLVKQLAGEPTGSALEIAGYSQLSVTSASSDHWEVWLKPGKSYYLYLSKGSDNNWQVQTPSAGSDLVQDDGLVQATYRISMHKALIPAPVYEMTQKCIFLAAHGATCDREPVEVFIRQQLSADPATIDKAPTNTQLTQFFMQHAALETAAALHYMPAGFELEKYLVSPTMHVQFSALKLLAANPSKDTPARLGTYVCSDKNDPASRRYALHLIAAQQMLDAAPILKGCVQSLPVDDGKFGLTALMDPRVGTRFPYNLRSTTENLLKDWKKD